LVCWGRHMKNIIFDFRHAECEFKVVEFKSELKN